MNIFKSLFGSKNSNEGKDPIGQDGLCQLHFNKEKSTFVKIKILPETTVEDIFNLPNVKSKQFLLFECGLIYNSNSQEISDSSSGSLSKSDIQLKKEYNIIVCDSNNRYSELVLNLYQKPFKYLKTPTSYLVCMPKEENDEENKIKKYNYLNDINENENKLEEYENLVKEEYLSKNKKRENKDYLLNGNLHTYSPTEKKLIKRRFQINEYQLTCPSDKLIINIDDIAVVNEKMSDPKKYYLSAFEDKNFMLEIITTSNLNYLFKCKNQSEYDSWKNCLDNFIQKRDDKRRNVDYNKKIINILKSFEEDYNLNQLYKELNVYMILNLKFLRTAFFSLFNDRIYTDIMESILTYKSTIKEENTINSLPGFKEIIGQLRVTSFKSEADEVKDKILYIIPIEKIEEYSRKKEETDNLFLKFSNMDELNKQISMILTPDLFDELFKNILQKIIVPFYDSELKDSYDKLFDEISKNKFPINKNVDNKKKIGEIDLDELFGDSVNKNKNNNKKEDISEEDKKLERNYEIIKRIQMILVKIFIQLYQFKDKDFLNIVKKKIS